MLASIRSATLLGVDGRRVAVEVHVSNGLPGFTIVGQPDAPCREARDRVRAALLTSGLPWPDRKVTVNLAPSDTRKVGGGLDLPIAVGVLAALGELPADALASAGFLGELGLDGSLRSVPGILPMVDALDTATVVVPAGAAHEAMAVGRHQVRAAPSLSTVVDALRGEVMWPDPPPPPPPSSAAERHPDLADVRGHAMARLAVEVAAAGGHHLLLVGPPGSGKTMLARRLAGLLPALDDEVAIAATRIRSAAGLGVPGGGLVRTPPLRVPHHGISAVGLIGGGTLGMRPGEASLAHGGCLFMDELGEFPAFVLDQLRQPIEEGVVRVSRARATLTFPARFLLVAAMNPCPCGDGGPAGWCRCSPFARSRYARRVSGPLLDRFDLRLSITRPEPCELLDTAPGEPTADVAARVQEARAIAARRGVRCNADLSLSAVDVVAPLTRAANALLDGALRAGSLTGRGLDRVRRVARTLADLGGRDGPLTDHDIALALSLRVEHPLGVAA